jgi:quercetin dioxygenase-like cupin family protein
VKILRPQVGSASPIGARPFAVERVASVDVAVGDGEAHAYVLYFDAGGLIGRHEAGFGQLFFAVSGDGWVAGDDGVRQPLREGEVAFIARGEVHSKGSDTGLTALMVQVRNLDALMPQQWP